MGIYVRGITMPNCCAECILFYDYMVCLATGDRTDWETEQERRMDNCPLIPVPDHGDLIDRDELVKHGVYMPQDGGYLPLIYMSYVKGAKAVIPAERSEE